MEVDARRERAGRVTSGSTRRLGAMSKRGDVYLRMLFIHGARSVLLRAGQLQRAGKPLTRLQRWALQAIISPLSVSIRTTPSPDEASW